MLEHGSMIISGWGPVSQPDPTAELQSAHVSAKQQQQVDRRGALAGTKRTRAVAGAAHTFICLEDFEGSRRAEQRLRRAAEAENTNADASVDNREGELVRDDADVTAADGLFSGTATEITRGQGEASDNLKFRVEAADHLQSQPEDDGEAAEHST